MSFHHPQIRAFPRGSKFWLWLASKLFVRLVLRAPQAETRTPTRPPAAARTPIVGVRKAAVCKDARGQLRTINLFLPADLVSELARPLDIRFFDGDEPVTAAQLAKAIQSNFVGGGQA